MLFSAAEAAQEIGCHISTVRQYLKDGVAGRKQRNGEWRITEEGLSDLREQYQSRSRRRPSKQYQCGQCGATFKDYQSKAARRKNDFCSPECHDEFRRKSVTRECVVCGSKWTLHGVRRNSALASRKTCSSECASVREKTGLQHGRGWNRKGWTISTQGYVMVRFPHHVRASHRGYVKLANLVMELKIGRILDQGEIVHHIDGDKQNDDPDNLQLFPSNSAHVKHHHRNGDYNLQGIKNTRQASSEHRGL